jgi:hypothetical protein
MNIDYIIKLHDAGLSNDEISKVVSALEQAPVETVKEPEPEQTPVKEEPATPAPGPAEDERYNQLLEAMNRLTGAIQAGNILYDNNKEVKTPSAEEILAQVISPSKRG